MTTPTPASAGKKGSACRVSKLVATAMSSRAGVGVEDRLHDGYADVGLSRHVVLLRR